MSNITDILKRGAIKITDASKGPGVAGQVFLVSEGNRVIASDLIKTPVAVSPVTGTSGVATNTTLSASAYSHGFDELRSFRRFEVRELGQTDWLTLLFSEEINADTSSSISPLLAEDSAFEWRCRDVATDGTMSDWMVTQSFTTGNAFIVTPTVMVEGEPSDVPETPIVSTSAFQTVGAADTHDSTDWEVRLQADNTLVYSSIADTVNLTSIQVPEGFLLENTTYVFRARHNGATLPPSAYGEKIATTELEFFKALALALNNSPFILLYDQNDATFNKTNDPNVFPSGASFDVSFSTDGEFLAIVHQNSPFVTIYSRSGNVFTKVADPDVSPNNTSLGVAFSADGAFLAVAHYFAPFLTIYSRSGNVFTKVANPNALPPNTSRGVAFSSDGAFLAVAHNSTPNVTIYSRSGNVFTTVTNPDVLPTGVGHGVAFSTDGAFLAVANFGTTPYITIYSRSGNVFTKVANPDVLPTGNSASVAFSADGAFLAVAHDVSPFITIYSRSGNVFTKVANPDVLPQNVGRSVAFSADGAFLAVGHGGSNLFVTIYSRSGNVFTKVANPDVLPMGNPLGVAFYPVAVPGSR